MFTSLVLAPNKMANKIVSIARNNTDINSLDYEKLMGQLIPANITEKCIHMADKVRAHVLEKYHNNLSKEKGRVLNEWKEIAPVTNVQSSHRREPSEQASLFPDNL